MAEHRTGTSAYSCTFSYDGVGNRLTSTAQDGAVTSYAYNPAHELLTTQALGAAPTTFGYDAAGNTVREVGPSANVTYTWDRENRLTQVSSAGSMETYTYDASGLRRRKTAGGATTNFVWDRVNLLSELDGNLARTAQYTDFPGVWGGLASQRRNGTSRHFVHDLSANTRALLDGGSVTDSYLYRAFGVEEATSGSTVNVLRFGGQVGYYRDLADRLYVRARYYRVGVGRWQSGDPEANNDQGVRWTYAHTYVANAPVLLVDPSGLYGPGVFPPEGIPLAAPEPGPDSGCAKPPYLTPGVYGCFCGPNRTVSDERPIDSLDQICQEHDACWRDVEFCQCNIISQVVSWCECRWTCKRCTEEFCRSVRERACNELPAGSLARSRCFRARRQILNLYCHWPFI